jgi:hypothetical protein
MRPDDRSTAGALHIAIDVALCTETLECASRVDRSMAAGAKDLALRSVCIAPAPFGAGIVARYASALGIGAAEAQMLLAGSIDDPGRRRQRAHAFLALRAVDPHPGGVGAFQ